MLTVIPNSPHSRAATRDIPEFLLLQLHEVCPIFPYTPADEAKLMTRGCLLCFKYGKHSFI